MFQKILVAIDRSEASKPVLAQAIALAKATNASLMLVHVLSTDEEGSPDLPVHPYASYYPIMNDTVWQSYRQQWDVYEEEMTAWLKQQAQTAIEAGVSTEFSQNSGSAGKTICDIARSWQAALIMVGSRGRSGLKELLLGSVSNYVMHHAPCSVLIVHPQKQGSPLQDNATQAEVLA
ncbi:universal stress protein [Almyronema epifaneia]|uniref:Universal stress protein n=1 Tax=Almyronema epifaneia S1 TaxID=2991925 RepID=A0ABW6I8Z3_9CYAN